MTQLLEIKEKMIRFYSQYETYLFMAVKAIVALAVFISINVTIGYMDKISSIPIAVILALICCLLPTNAIILLGALLVLLDMYAIALEAALVTFVLFAILYFIYYRFAPKDGIAAVLTPIGFQLGVPFAVPIAYSLIRPLYSLLSLMCGTVIYYFLDGVHQNASMLVSATEENAESSSKLNVMIGQIVGNKELFLVLGILVLTYLLVYFVRRLSIEHAWTIAIVAGTIFEIIGLFVGYLLLNISGKGVMLIVGGIISMLIGFLVQFFCMDLDYARTERVQFEDDDYYYYVTAVPKKMIASREKRVQHFGNTSSMGRKIDREKANTSVPNEEVSRKVIAKELEIDEDLLK